MPIYTIACPSPLLFNSTFYCNLHTPSHTTYPPFLFLSLSYLTTFLSHNPLQPIHSLSTVCSLYCVYNIPYIFRIRETLSLLCSPNNISFPTFNLFPQHHRTTIFVDVSHHSSILSGPSYAHSPLLNDMSTSLLHVSINLICVCVCVCCRYHQVSNLIQNYSPASLLSVLHIYYQYPLPLTRSTNLLSTKTIHMTLQPRQPIIERYLRSTPLFSPLFPVFLSNMCLCHLCVCCLRPLYLHSAQFHTYHYQTYDTFILYTII
jgi:hypothetical protein